MSTFCQRNHLLCALELTSGNLQSKIRNATTPIVTSVAKLKNLRSYKSAKSLHEAVQDTPETPEIPQEWARRHSGEGSDTKSKKKWHLGKKGESDPNKSLPPTPTLAEKIETIEEASDITLFRRSEPKKAKKLLTRSGATETSGEDCYAAATNSCPDPVWNREALGNYMLNAAHEVRKRQAAKALSATEGTSTSFTRRLDHKVEAIHKVHEMLTRKSDAGSDVGSNAPSDGVSVESHPLSMSAKMPHGVGDSTTSAPSPPAEGALSATITSPADLDHDMWLTKGLREVSADKQPPKDTSHTEPQLQRTGDGTTEAESEIGQGTATDTSAPVGLGVEVPSTSSPTQPKHNEPRSDSPTVPRSILPVTDDDHNRRRSTASAWSDDSSHSIKCPVPISIADPFSIHEAAKKHCPYYPGYDPDAEEDAALLPEVNKCRPKGPIAQHLRQQDERTDGGEESDHGRSTDYAAQLAAVLEKATKAREDFRSDWSGSDTPGNIPGSVAQHQKEGARDLIPYGKDDTDIKAHNESTAKSSKTLAPNINTRDNPSVSGSEQSTGNGLSCIKFARPLSTSLLQFNPQIASALTSKFSWTSSSPDPSESQYLQNDDVKEIEDVGAYDTQILALASTRGVQAQAGLNITSTRTEKQYGTLSQPAELVGDAPRQMKLEKSNAESEGGQGAEGTVTPAHGEAFTTIIDVMNQQDAELKGKAPAGSSPKVEEELRHIHPAFRVEAEETFAQTGRFFTDPQKEKYGLGPNSPSAPSPLGKFVGLSPVQSSLPFQGFSPAPNSPLTPSPLSPSGRRVASALQYSAIVSTQIVPNSIPGTPPHRKKVLETLFAPSALRISSLSQTRPAIPARDWATSATGSPHAVRKYPTLQYLVRQPGEAQSAPLPCASSASGSSVNVDAVISEWEHAYLCGEKVRTATRLNSHKLTTSQMQKIRKALGLPRIEPRDPSEVQHVHPGHGFLWDTRKLCCRSGHEGCCSSCYAACCKMEELEALLAHNKGRLAEEGIRGKISKLRAFAEDGVESFRVLLECVQCEERKCPRCCGLCPVEGCRVVICTECREDFGELCAEHEEMQR